MRFKSPDAYTFDTQHISSLIESKISDLATLRQRVPGSILVALDTEGHADGYRSATENIAEIGVAVMQSNESKPRFTPHLSQFYEENNIEAFTLRVRERRYGPVAGTMVDVRSADAGFRLKRFLDDFPGDRILLGYSMRAEFDWITEQCPSIANYFTAWCDVQELVAQKYNEDTPALSNTPGLCHSPGLQNTLKDMRISGWRSKHQVHSAAGDSVKLLAVMSALLCDITIQQRDCCKGVSMFCYLPPSEKTKVGPKIHPFAARITNETGDKLPLQTPKGLKTLCEKYAGLKGVGLRSRTECLAEVQVRYWWVSFQSQDDLDSFILNFNGSIIGEIKLCVVPVKNRLTQVQSTKSVKDRTCKPGLS